MKRLLFTSLLSLALPVGLFADEKPKDPYAQAVASYVQGATAEMKALRTELETTVKQTPAAAKPRFAPVTEKLVDCERILGDLKTAGPSNFDTVKADYEKARGELLKIFAKARQG